MQIVERKPRSIIIDGIVDREVQSRNFKGEEKKDKVTGRTVNSPGRRNFLLILNEEIAEELKDRGCEVKYKKVTNPNDVPEPFISVTVSYYLRPVDAYIISKGVTTPLDEAHVGKIDAVDIKNMAIELEFGKEKVHQAGASAGLSYVPIFANQIWVEVVPSYFMEKYGYMNGGADPGMASPPPVGAFEGEEPPFTM